MALNTERLLINSVREFPLATGTSVTDEGQALVRVIEDGIEKVKPATGAASEVFIGFSYGQRFTPTVRAHYQTFNVPSASPYTVTLPFEPLSGQYYIYDVTGSNANTADTAAAANKHSISGKTLTFDSSDAGNSMTIQMRYSVTVSELMYEGTPTPVTTNASQVIGSVGVITSGEIETDRFSAAVSYSAATSLRMLAGGIITDQTGTNNNTIRTLNNNVFITKYPDAVNAFLGIRF